MKRLNKALNLESEETTITKVLHDVPMQPLFTITPMLQQKKAMLFGNYCHHYSSSLSNNQLATDILFPVRRSIHWPLFLMKQLHCHRPGSSTQSMLAQPYLWGNLLSTLDKWGGKIKEKITIP